MTADTDLAYMAGLIDGEGCVSIDKINHKNGRTYYGLRVTFTNSSIEVIEWIKDHFAKHTWHTTDHRGKKSIHCMVWRSDQAAELLRSLQPYLVVKARHAEWAILFQDSLPDVGKAKTTTDEELAWRAEVREWMMHLNHS